MNMLRSLPGGLSIVFLGGVIAAVSATYPLGGATRMGPGYLPLVAGIAMMAIGALITIGDWRASALAVPDGEETPLILRPILAVFAGLVAWVLIAPRLGLVPATVVLVILSSFAQPRPRPLPTLATAVVLSILGVVVFIWGLGIRMDAIRF